MRNRLAVHWVLSVGLLIFSSAAFAAAPPAQPASGPGGRDYRHAGFRQSKFEEGPKGYWLFEPKDPAPGKAPVLIFMHGWGATNPRIYGAWIKHLVRRGNIVVYPLYQQPGSFRFPPAEITPNALSTVKNAIERLGSADHVRPDLTRVAVVGHSAGGQIAANLAALAGSTNAQELPPFRAVMSVQPGKSWAKLDQIKIPLADLSQIPKSTLLLTVAGDQDRIARDLDAKRIFEESTQVASRNKNFIVIRSDKHGTPALLANHFAPTAPATDVGEPPPRPSTKLREKIASWIKERWGKIRDEEAAPEYFNLQQRNGADGATASADAIDYFGLWKLFDALCDAAFYGKNRPYALGNTHQQRYMGKWSDGVAVKELVVYDKP